MVQAENRIKGDYMKIKVDSPDFTKEAIYNATERKIDVPQITKTYIAVDNKGIKQELSSSVVTVIEE